jgi:amino acid adenylation domain-containing protein
VTVGRPTKSVEERLAQLSPQRREALERLLREKNAAVTPVSIPSRSPEEVALLSFGQQRIWILDQLAPGNPFYNETQMMRFTFALNIAAFEQSINEIVRRHEVLRTTFQVREGQPIQVIAPELKVDLRVVELRGLPEAERLARALALAQEEGRHPFSLPEGPLIRTLLFQLGEEDSLFVVNAHHIVSDGWSFGVFDFELTSLYQAYSHGYSSPLPPLKIQYGDFALWQRKYMQGEVLERQLQYWRTQLADLPVLGLPTDRPRPPVASFRGARISFSVPRPAYADLDGIVKAEGVSLFMVLLAAFQVLLHRLTSAEDIVVGSPMTNRQYKETEGLIGFFVNTLVLRTRITGDITFRELLARVRSTVLEAFNHQDLPFEKLVQELHPQRDLARNPLFQVAFQFFAAPSSTGLVPGRLLPMQPIHNSTAKFDLRCDMVLAGEELLGLFEYSTDLFDESTIRRFVGYFLNILGSADDIDKAVGDLPLLSEEEKRRILIDWNHTTAPLRREASLAELFCEQAWRSPDAVAGIESDRTLTYSELDRWADHIGGELISAGVAPGDRVAICVPRSLAFVATVLGVLKCGCTYIPLDPEAPLQRLRSLLADAEVRVIVTTGSNEGRWRGEGFAVVLVGDPIPSGVATVSFPKHEAAGDAIAYVMYTSGSTGGPKGVEVPHRAVARLVLNTNYISVKSTDTVALASNIAFDASTFEIWGALLNGARLSVVSRDEVLSAEELERRIAADAITILFLTTDLCHRHVLERPGMFSRLRVLLFGGSKVDPQWVRTMLHAGPPECLLHVYGPTETTTFACAYQVLDVPQDAFTIPIGRPISNTEVYVLDGRMNPMPIGAVGELYIGGDGLARGYLKNPEMAAAQFVPHPFGVDPEERLYRTGDLVRYLPDGALEFIGRVDQQVKLRGFRVEPGEIEACLRVHREVQDAVVLPAGEPPDQVRLVAYVVPKSRTTHGEEHPAGLVEHWRSVYDSIIYGSSDVNGGGAPDPTFNIAGWTSSYTYEPLSPAEMQEQVDGTVKRILELRPRRVLEIGCGMGLLLFRIAPACESYVGTDFSEVALTYVRDHLETSRCGHARLIYGKADDFAQFGEERFDTIILNSVVQYFPGIDYLRTVLGGALDRLEDGGRIFVGDVRNFALLDAFYVSLELHRAPDLLDLHELKERVQRSRSGEQELVVDPSFFVAFARANRRIAGVRMEPKRGWIRNELTQFRYDIVLATDVQKPYSDPEWAPWRTDILSLDRLREKLRKSVKPVGVRRIPNARTAEAVLACDLLLYPDAASTVGELRERLHDTAQDGIDPEELSRLAEEAGWKVSFDLSQGSPDGSFGAVFTPVANGDRWMFVPQQLQVARHTKANTPVSPHPEVRLLESLRGYLRSRLPDYMLPSDFVVLDALPLNANGKVNTNALPVPERQRPELHRAFVEPRTPLEQVLCGIWREVLQLERVGLDDSFFDLGGHSLLATQLVSRIRDTLDVKLPLRRLFETLTVARLAEAMLGSCPDPVLLNKRAELVIAISSMSDEDVAKRLSAVAESDPR